MFIPNMLTETPRRCKSRPVSNPVGPPIMGFASALQYRPMVLSVVYSANIPPTIATSTTSTSLFEVHILVKL